MICPHCGQDAPPILRGIEPRCPICGRLRDPFVATPVNVAGQPSRVGGAIARVLGWLILGGGLLLAVILGAILQAIFPAGVAGIIVGLAIAIASAIAGGLLLAGGRGLAARGADAERAAHVRVLYALASHRGGVVLAADAARSLGVGAAQADRLLTDLAKDPEENVDVEIGERGEVLYVFKGFRRQRVAAEPPRVRVGAEARGAGAGHEEEEEEEPEAPAERREGARRP